MNVGMKLNVGCGIYPAVDWVNTDVDNTVAKPDVLVTPDEPFPFEDDSVAKVYLGHVLEHVPLHKMAAFLDDLKRVLRPGALVCVVGPDTIKALHQWRDNPERWGRLWATLEGPDPYIEPSAELWEGAYHHWNCYEARVVSILETHGFTDVQIRQPTRGELAGWPLVDPAADQCAVLARYEP